MLRAAAALLPDGRLHLHHGPIDLIVDAHGPGRAAAFDRVRARFATVLEELAAELPELRRPVTGAPRLHGTVARRMLVAAAPFAPAFVTPMAAVAGAVADEMLAVIRAQGGIDRAYVNNGGDAALWLRPGQSMRAAVAAPVPAMLSLTAGDGVGGVATSGRGGRSHSLGIADSVTVLAASAAAADAAATLIANAVDLPGHPAIRRRPANRLSPDSDLGARPVTIAVGALGEREVAAALEAGARAAATYRARGLLIGAILMLGRQHRIVGAAPTVPLNAGSGAGDLRAFGRLTGS
ncbi:UPF0280 family protein [Rhodobacteraceae bacterium 2CG4]|uniref:UPF0280 family protein n=1 Tax=Halovulum marinum TaxID=2662447 RepID=A0A6L5YXZ3_9RHOB|nr:UPF0280 family protein [Halovulum marinum]MSU88722.1 UPF0280 family protein [Halovulum marinum]